VRWPCSSRAPLHSLSPMEVSTLPPGLGGENDVRDFHPFIEGFAHIVDCEGRGGNGDQGFHFHARLGGPWSLWIVLPRHFGIAVRSHQCASAPVDDKEVSIPRFSWRPRFPRSAPLPADSPSGFSGVGLRSRRAASIFTKPRAAAFASSLLLSPTRRPSALRLSLRNATALSCRWA